jgi:type II secretory pathway component GspD/PulD (secretin)
MVTASAQEDPNAGLESVKQAESQPFAAQSADAKRAEGSLRFAFEGAPWREVIRWIADEAGLALHVGDLPTGSFTYSDPAEFTHQQAIDRINLFLQPQGFTIIRSGNLLSVINLGDPRSMQQLDSLADMVTVKQLDQRENHDVVKCIFPLGDIKAEDAVQELTVLKLMTTPEVLAKTNQLIVTDTAGKLKSVKSVLDAFRPDTLDNGTIVQSFALKHVDAEDILVVARPHLGLATGETIGIDVSVSADLPGKNIFATGVEDKVKLLENLVLALDQPDRVLSANGEEPELKSHSVPGGNVEIVYNVLQTLLAGKNVRLSMDEAAGSVVALATPTVQKEITATVAQLQAAEADFEVIPLKTVDPYFAISLLEEMLDLPDEFADPDEIPWDAPKIDADPGNMRLFVRAKRHQIEQIKKIVEGLDTTGAVGTGEAIRVLPLKGKVAEQILDTAVKFWRGGNPVVMYRSTTLGQPIQTERVLSGPQPQPAIMPTAARLGGLNSRDQRLVTTNANSPEPAIRCQVTPRGVLLQSDDTSALDRFEEHLRTIAGPADSVPSPPIVFYLKYTKAADAIRMLAELLDGGEAASEAEAGTLVNGYVSSGLTDSFLGSFVTASDGTITMTSGSMTVVADPRLNRLITQGSAADIERIEQYLLIIDKDNSITSIETYGTSHVIELVNTRASEVAAAIREAYAGRVAAAATDAGAQGGKASPQQAREAAAAAAKEAAAKAKEQGGSKKAPAKQTGTKERDLEPKMTIAVHEASNSLIVTAPEQLFQEVEKLATELDSRGAQTIEVIAPINGVLLESVLQEVLLGEAPTSSAGSGDRNRSSSSATRPSSVPSSQSSKSSNGR